MTIGKAAGLTLGFLVAVAIGVAISPAVRSMMGPGDSATITARPAPPVTEEAGPEATVKTPRAAPSRAKAGESPATAAAPRRASVAASEPRLHDRLKSVLNRGARIDVAAEGFASGEEFATVAHAARNTNVPFLVLKHRVLNEKRSLADAIRESRPDMVDVTVEVTRARTAARADVAAAVEG